MNDNQGLSGHVFWEIRDELGNLKSSGESRNLITDVGDTVYATNGAGGATITPASKPTGMKLGTGANSGANVPAKAGAGAALTTYLTNSHQAFDSGFPSGLLATGAGYTVTYKVTYAAGKATSASNPITEAVIVNDVLADATSAAANTVSRVPLSGIGSKNASDTLTLTWTHKILGQ